MWGQPPSAVRRPGLIGPQRPQSVGRKNSLKFSMRTLSSRKPVDQPCVCFCHLERSRRIPTPHIALRHLSEFSSTHPARCFPFCHPERSRGTLCFVPRQHDTHTPVPHPRHPRALCIPPTRGVQRTRQEGGPTAKCRRTLFLLGSDAQPVRVRLPVAPP